MSQSEVVNKTIFLWIVVLLGLGVVAGSVLQMSSISYYQGIHPSFAAVYYDNKFYTTAEPGDASTSRIGVATLNFDPDDWDTGKPNLHGELTDIQVITDLARYEVPETFTHIINKFGGTPAKDSPYKTYTWEVPQGDGTTKVYEMQLWLCSFSVNTFIKADINTRFVLDPVMIAYYRLQSERNNKRYIDDEVWIKLETTNEWGSYFTDPLIEKTYFGIAYMELADFEIYAEDPNLDVLPRSQWVAMDLYDDPHGLPVKPGDPIQKAESITGSIVNPTFFKQEYYTKITLGNVGTYDYNLIDTSYKADAFQHTILVHVFVVGEWTVQPDIPRDPDVPTPPEYTGWLEGLANAIENLIADLTSPLGKIKLAIVVLVCVILFVFITNPGLIVDWIKTSKQIKKEIRKK